MTSSDVPRTGRCFGDGNPVYEQYHDEEWGRPVHGEHALYERFALEAFQSGLAWITILRKRPAFRAAFADFDPEVVAAFDDDDVARLMADAGIVRNRAKIEATIANGRALRDLHASGRTLDQVLWSHAPDRSSHQPAGHLGGRAGADGGEPRARQGAQAAGLPVRRSRHRVRRDAGLRRRRRPPGDLPHGHGGRGEPLTCRPARA